MHSTPRDLLDFLELPVFSRRWAQLGLDDEGDLWALQITIMRDPLGAPVISGTRGIRKLRFVPPRWNVGKRGACRVLYVYFPSLGMVLLCLAYDKRERDNISAADKRVLNQLIDSIEEELRRRLSR